MFQGGYLQYIDNTMKEITQFNTCVDEEEQIRNFYNQIPQVVDNLLKFWETKSGFEHLEPAPMPSHKAVVQIIHKARGILFPGYFTSTKLNHSNLEYFLGQETSSLYEDLSKQIILAIQHDCFRRKLPCSQCKSKGHEIALKFISALPDLEVLLTSDIKATLQGDPAAKGADEVIFSYPGLLAITIYRIAHILLNLGVPIIPRIMTEHAHNLTGIDIHPGAIIGESFFIDHGTGIVIGETTEIGRGVRIYQGVTLGALSLPHDAGERFRNSKRHPTIEEDVIIYANTTILGGQTTIGARAVIGGNIWITESVAPDTKVLLKRPELYYQDRCTNRKTSTGS